MARPHHHHRAAVAIVIAIALTLLASNDARADGRAELEKARASYLARNWADAEERLHVLLDPKSSTGLKERSLISQARMYLGASLLAQGKKVEAKDTFEKLVLDDPTFDPDPLSFQSDAINTFIDVRSSLLEQIKTQTATAARLAAERKIREDAEREAQRVWLEKVKKQASEETVTVRHSRIVASVPFGVGQFQNGQSVLGWAFLGTEAVAIIGTTITWGMFRYARGREDDELYGVKQLSPQWHQRAEDLRFVNIGFALSFLAIAGVGIGQAHFAYVPESPEKKKRDLPAMGEKSASAAAPRPPTLPPKQHAPLSLSSIAPIVSPLDRGGFFVGVSGLSF